MGKVYAKSRLTLCLSPASHKALRCLVECRHVWGYWQTCGVDIFIIHVDRSSEFYQSNVILVLRMNILRVNNEIFNNSVVFTALINIKAVFTNSHFHIVSAAKSVKWYKNSASHLPHLASCKSELTWQKQLSLIVGNIASNHQYINTTQYIFFVSRKPYFENIISVFSWSRLNMQITADDIHVIWWLHRTLSML